MIPKSARAYIAAIATLAATVLAAAIYRWNPENLRNAVLFFTLALLASAMKIRLPGLKGNISVNFVFVLAAIALFGFTEAVLIGFGGALVQSLWKTQGRPKPVQVLFNVSCLTVCAAAAFWGSRLALAALGSHSIAALISVAASIYLVLNTGLVSLVISLSEDRSLIQVWSQCYQWILPYFLVGAALAGLAAATSGGTNLDVALLIVPTMYFVYLYYRKDIEKHA